MSERLVVVGDIHGHIRAFDQVLDYYGDRIDGVVTTGDAIAGGWESKEVIDRQRQIGARAIMANNEWDTLGPLFHHDLTERFAMQEAWMMAGYKNKRQSLFHSYGIPSGLLPAEAIRRLAGVMEEAGHAEYLLNLPLYREEADFIAVHAGLEPDVEWDLQRMQLDLIGWGLRWVKDFSRPPIQITSHKLARDPSTPMMTDKVLVTGHAHSGCGPVDQRVTGDGRRVRLATHHWDNEPLLVWESWTGEVRPFSPAT